MSCISLHTDGHIRFIGNDSVVGAAQREFNHCTVVTCTAPFLPQKRRWVLTIDDFGAQDMPLNRKAWACYGRSPIYGTAFFGPDDDDDVPAELVELLSTPLAEWPISDAALAVLTGDEPDRPRMLHQRPGT